jgi:hypothetical protein
MIIFQSGAWLTSGPMSVNLIGFESFSISRHFRTFHFRTTRHQRTDAADQTLTEHFLLEITRRASARMSMLRKNT